MNLVLGFGGGANQGFGLIGTVGYMVVFFGAMWFLIIRPQKKREKDIIDMQNAVKVGDHVVLHSGEYGKVVDVVNDLFVIEFGLNKSVRIPVKKGAVAAIQEPNLSVGKKVVETKEEPKVGTRVVEEDGVEYEYIEVEEEVQE